jgi:hypothetical protein
MYKHTPQVNIAVARHNADAMDLLDAYADKRKISRSETVFWLVREQQKRDLVGATR